ncbi:hypothetical protein, partial [Chlorogloeopsis sp. ULAP01]|uniref:hypothetical protein n=1 Tax=Chlorogloeopsis sp. ULAP01 TaxID=3056483 RepID=UPI0025AD7420
CGGEPALLAGFQRTVPTTGENLRSRHPTGSRPPGVYNGGLWGPHGVGLGENPRTALLLATDCPPPQVTGVDT